MKPFKSYNFTWWQIGIFKLALLAIGAIVGAYWHNFVSDNLVVFALVALAASVYIAYIALKQQNP